MTGQHKTCASHLSASSFSPSRSIKLQWQSRSCNMSTRSTKMKSSVPTRETSWFGEGPMAEPFENFRRIGRRNLHHVRKLHGQLQCWSRRLARAQFRMEQRLWFQELPDQHRASSMHPCTSESDSDDFDYGALMDRNQLSQTSSSVSAPSWP